MSPASYADRLAVAERYLTTAQSLLKIRKHGRRLNALLFMAADEIGAIADEIGPELAARDAAGDGTAELDDLNSRLCRLETKRQVILVEAGETFSLDAHRMAAGDSLELAKLAYRVASGTRTALEPATAAELIGLVSEDGAQVLLIAQDKSKTVEQRMRLIVAIDERYAGFNGERWATLLGCSGTRAREMLARILKEGKRL